MMRRRDVITLLGGAAGWPMVARAQQATVPMIGFLSISSLEGIEHLVAAFGKLLPRAAISKAKTWQ